MKLKNFVIYGETTGRVLGERTRFTAEEALADLPELFLAIEVEGSGYNETSHKVDLETLELIPITPVDDPGPVDTMTPEEKSVAYKAGLL